MSERILEQEAVPGWKNTNRESCTAFAVAQSVMAEAVVSFAVETLGNSLLEEAKFLHGVRAQVEELKTELNRMQCFLKDADRRQDESEGIRNWVSEIREAAYEAEDVIDAFASKQALRSSGPLNLLKRYSCIFVGWIELHHVGSKIDAIKSKISNLRVSLQTYDIRATTAVEGPSSKITRQQELRRSSSHIKEDVVVGFEKDTEKLVAQLVDKAKLNRVLSICGMGGIGKTTLVKRIYHQQQIRSNFDCFAWVCISQQFPTRKVWEEILFKLISASAEERDKISKQTDDEVAKTFIKFNLRENVW